MPGCQRQNAFRSCLLILAGTLEIAGCVNYAGIKNQAVPLNEKSLAVKHHYSAAPRTTTPSANWWARFHDPQLSRLITTALTDSPTMQIAADRIRKAQNLTKGVESYMWPSVDFSGYAERARFSQFGLVPPPFNGKTFNIGDLGLNFNYELDLWGKNRQQFATKLSEECAEKTNYAQAQLVLSTAVANAYFQLQANHTLFKIAEDTLKQRAEIFSIVKARADHNIESDIPVQVALADQQAAKLTVERFIEAEKRSRYRLAVLLGKNPLNTNIVTYPFAYHVYHLALPANLPANLLGHRPDIIAARERTEAAAHQINVAKARFFPNINLNAIFSYQSVFFNRLFEAGSQANSGTVAVDLPIFDAGARRAQLGLRYAEYDEAVDKYNQMILNALKETADQLARLASLSSQLTAEQRALHASQQALLLTHMRYQHGIVDYLKVLEIKGALLQQQAVQTDLQSRHLLAVVAMIKALGGSPINFKERA